MKKLFLLSVAALVTFAACQKEINPAKQEAGITALTATVEQHTGDTKTALGNSNSVIWSEGDVIKVWNVSNESGDFTLTDGAGTTHGIFNGDEIADPLYAFYPASAVSSVEGSVATFTLPATQHYVKNTFDNGANIAVAQISGISMQFKNVCGVLKLQLKGTTLVKSIVVKGKNNEKLNGEYTVNAGFETEPDMPCVTTETESEKTITLDCGDGVLLSPSKIINFYIVVPKGAFAHGFEVTINDTFAASEEVKTSFANTVNRNVILSMPEKSVNIKGFVLPGEFSVSAEKKIRFACGNLVATVDDAGNPTDWTFAEHQYAFLGKGGANETLGTTGGDIDMFAWSSDGAGASEKWKPWGIFDEGSTANGGDNFVDWGTNPQLMMSVGSYWRTLTSNEMSYILSTRAASVIGVISNARYACVKVNDINGLLLFPDSFIWTDEMGEAPATINNTSPSWDDINYSLAEFSAMEASGCVFFPTCGYCLNGTVSNINREASLWSATTYDSSINASRLNFKDGLTYSEKTDPKVLRHSVRLVTDVVE